MRVSFSMETAERGVRLRRGVLGLEREGNLGRVGGAGQKLLTWGLLEEEKEERGKRDGEEDEGTERVAVGGGIANKNGDKLRF